MQPATVDSAPIMPSVSIVMMAIGSNNDGRVAMLNKNMTTPLNTMTNDRALIISAPSLSKIVDDHLRLFGL